MPPGGSGPPVHTPAEKNQSVKEPSTIVAKGNEEFRQHFPQPGWVEHAPEEIWQATL